MLFAVDQPLTETQGWFLVVEVGIIALLALITFVMRGRT
jgi:hypothetical protein